MENKRYGSRDSKNDSRRGDKTDRKGGRSNNNRRHKDKDAKKESGEAKRRDYKTDRDKPAGSENKRDNRKPYKTESGERTEKSYRKPYKKDREWERDSDKKTDGRRAYKPKGYDAKSKSGYAKKRTTKEEKISEDIRLNRYIALSGVCARREADALIAKGKIKVNGKVVTELGTKVTRKDKVEYEGKNLNPERKVYIVMNKPKDTVTTLDDPHAERTVIDLLGEKVAERVFPVGRLDKNTMGVLLLTNDGELAQRMTHPSFRIKKVYHVYLDKALTKNDMTQLVDGIELDDGPIAVDKIAYTDEEDRSRVGLEIHSGRNRIVRRMFEHLGYKVRRLDRVAFGPLTKKGLQRGHWRILQGREMGFLHQAGHAVKSNLEKKKPGRKD